MTVQDRGRRQQPVVVVTGRGRPHEIVFILLALLLGIAYTVGTPPPESLAHLVPYALVRVWSVALLISGIVGLISVLLRASRRSLLLEVGSMMLGAGALILVASAVIGFAGIPRALLGAGICISWALANLVRARQIVRHDLRELR